MVVSRRCVEKLGDQVVIKKTLINTNSLEDHQNHNCTI